MSGTTITRMHQIPKISNPLSESDKITLSQFTVQNVYQTASVEIKSIIGYLDQALIKVGGWAVFQISQGIKGDGSQSNPLRVDTDWVSLNYVPTNSLPVSQVGNLKTRYLPLTLNRYNQFSSYNSADQRCPICPILTTEGELAIWLQGVQAHKLSIGNWVNDGNTQSAQLIERPFSVTSIPGTIIGVVSITTTAAILKVLNNGSYENWMVSIKDGNLTASNPNLKPVRLGGESDGSGYFKGRSMSALVVSNLRYLFICNDGVGANGAGQTMVFQVSGDGTGGTLTQLSGWTISSYGGLFTNQTQIRYSDQFLGTSSTNCELIDAIGNTQVTFVNDRQVSSTLSLYQNPLNLTDIYLIIRRERIVTNGQSLRYSADLVFKINLLTGSGSALAVDRYSTLTPILSQSNGKLSIANQRNTFKGANRSDNENEAITVLADGTVVVVGDRYDRLSGGAKTLFQANAFNGVWTGGDIHALAQSNISGVEFDITPDYTATPSTLELLISSAFPVYINGVHATIGSGTYDLASLASQSPSIDLSKTVGIPVTYSGIRGKKIQLYIQQAGSVVVLVATNTELAETASNAWLGCILIPDNQAIPPVIIGWAFSRIGQYRLSRIPQGSAVSATGDNPASAASYWWLQKVTPGPIYPRFYSDASLNYPVISVMTGTRVYVRYHVAKSAFNANYQCSINGVSLGTSTWVGNDLVFSGVVSTSILTGEEQACLITNLDLGTVVARSSINVVKTPITFDMLSQDQSKAVSKVYDGTVISLRIKTFLGLIGSNVNVSLNGSLVSTLSYAGNTLYTTLTLSQIGTNTITVSNGNGSITGTITVVAYAGIQSNTVNGSVDNNASTITVGGQNNTFIITNLAKALQYVGRYYLTHVDNSNTGTTVTINGNVVYTGSGSQDYSSGQKDISSLLVEGTNTINATYGKIILQGPILQSI